MPLASIADAIVNGIEIGLIWRLFTLVWAMKEQNALREESIASLAWDIELLKDRDLGLDNRLYNINELRDKVDDLEVKIALLQKPPGNGRDEP